jgi:peptidoglycan hydrolase-like protein with peptidoglycan-binding domain
MSLMIGSTLAACRLALALIAFAAALRACARFGPLNFTRRILGRASADFGPNTKASVKAFQVWGGVTSDGVVGDQTWAVSLHATSATLESAVGLQFVIG